MVARKEGEREIERKERCKDNIPYKDMTPCDLFPLPRHGNHKTKTLSKYAKEKKKGFKE
jgi:hypothetical protein